jgi:hypothetical protein
MKAHVLLGWRSARFRAARLGVAFKHRRVTSSSEPHSALHLHGVCPREPNGSVVLISDSRRSELRNGEERVYGEVGSLLGQPPLRTASAGGQGRVFN